MNAPSRQTVAEKLKCYRMRSNPALCNNKDCSYNNRDPVMGYYCCWNRLIHDAETLLKEPQDKYGKAWCEMRETIEEMRDNGGTGNQEEVCRFLSSLMDVIERRMDE